MKTAAQRESQAAQCYFMEAISNEDGNLFSYKLQSILVQMASGSCEAYSLFPVMDESSAPGLSPSVMR